jgi:hypothetical protein
MSSKYSVGDLVNVCVNTENDAFNGLVLAKSSLDGWWYQIEALDEADMPGKFWFRESKIVKAIEKEEQKAAATTKSVSA